jgi:hypothetical protein
MATAVFPEILGNLQYGSFPKTEVIHVLRVLVN